MNRFWRVVLNVCATIVGILIITLWKKPIIGALIIVVYGLIDLYWHKLRARE